MAKLETARVDHRSNVLRAHVPHKLPIMSMPVNIDDNPVVFQKHVSLALRAEPEAVALSISECVCL